MRPEPRFLTREWRHGNRKNRLPCLQSTPHKQIPPHAALSRRSEHPHLGSSKTLIGSEQPDGLASSSKSDREKANRSKKHQRLKHTLANRHPTTAITDKGEPLDQAEEDDQSNRHKVGDLLVRETRNTVVDPKI